MPDRAPARRRPSRYCSLHDCGCARRRTPLAPGAAVRRRHVRSFLQSRYLWSLVSPGRAAPAQTALAACRCMPLKKASSATTGTYVGDSGAFLFSLSSVATRPGDVDHKHNCGVVGQTTNFACSSYGRTYIGSNYARHGVPAPIFRSPPTLGAIRVSKAPEANRTCERLRTLGSLGTLSSCRVGSEGTAECVRGSIYISASRVMDGRWNRRSSKPHSNRRCTHGAAACAGPNSVDQLCICIVQK